MKKETIEIKRVIKFRVWDVSDKKWTTEINLPFSQEVVGMCSFMNYPNKYIYQQFTGLFDKNGKEIYEGDILLCYPDNTGLKLIDSGNIYGGVYDAPIYEADENLPKRAELDLVVYKGFVRYSEYLCCFELKTINDPIIAASQISRTKFLYEVIGNIFENSELLNN